MGKVNWKAKLEHEFLNNYKILQQAFDDCKIQKNIEVEKLSKGRTQDNLEFLQWLKRYYDLNNPGIDYDAEKRRFGNDLENAKENFNSTNMKKRDNSKDFKNNFAPNFVKKVNVSSTTNLKTINQEKTTAKVSSSNVSNVTNVLSTAKSVRSVIDKDAETNECKLT
jgi:hypothetical protein